MGEGQSDQRRSRFRIVVGILLAIGMVAGWLVGGSLGEPGFVLLMCSLSMGASFFGRGFAVPGAIAAFLVLRTEPVVGVAIAGVAIVIGERTHHLRGRLGRFAQRSFTDRLTGLFNYDFLQAQVRFEVDRVKRYGGACSVLVLDLDNFKRFNDTHGHQAGNLLLRALADSIRAEKRHTDIAARFGGEEFVVLVPSGTQDAVRLAERLREATSEIVLPQLGEDGRVTVSVGVASYPEQASNAAELFERADQALYVAKEGGKNQVIVWPNTRVMRAPAQEANVNVAAPVDVS
jgi:diguanylate cyclase (GGDEF)-like protein